MKIHHKFIFIISLLILTLVSIVISITTQPTIQVVSTNPPPDSNYIDSNIIPTFVFNKKVNSKKIDFSVDPHELFEVSQVSNKKIVLIFKKPLRLNTKYSITLTNNNKNFYILSFHTTVSEKIYYDPRFLNDLQEDLDRDYPLMAKTPHETPNYRLVYSAPLTLEISLKKSTITQEEALSYARDWVKEQGMEPSTHKYVVSDELYLPSPTPTHKLKNQNAEEPTPSPTPTEIDWENLQDDGT